jgi:hypothetical protein
MSFALTRSDLRQPTIRRFNKAEAAELFQTFPDFSRKFPDGWLIHP